MAKTTKTGTTDTPAIPDDISAKIQKIIYDLEEFKEHYKSQLEALKSAQEDKGKAGDAIFALYKNLLDKTALLKWNKIVQKQIGVKGKSNNTACQKTIKLF